MSPNVTMSLVAKTRVYHLEKKKGPIPQVSPQDLSKFGFGHVPVSSLNTSHNLPSQH